MNIEFFNPIHFIKLQDWVYLIIADRDNVNVLYFVNLLKYINLHTIIEGNSIKNLNFAGMEEYSKDMLHKNIGARPRSYENHINRVFL